MTPVLRVWLSTADNARWSCPAARFRRMEQVSWVGRLMRPWRC